METCFEKVKCCKYLWPHVAVDGGTEGKVQFRINEVGKVCGTIKNV